MPRFVARLIFVQRREVLPVVKPSARGSVCAVFAATTCRVPELSWVLEVSPDPEAFRQGFFPAATVLEHAFWAGLAQW